MTDRLLIFNRNWECLFDKTFLDLSGISTQLSQINIGSDKNIARTNSQLNIRENSNDESKLLIGTIYSLQKVLNRMLLKPAEDSLGFSDLKIFIDSEETRLHYFETPTNLRFLALTKSSTSENNNLLPLFYQEIFVPHVCRNPLILRSSDASYISIFQLSLFKQETYKYFKRQYN